VSELCLFPDQTRTLYWGAESLLSECIGPRQSADPLMDFTKRDVVKWLAKRKSSGNILLPRWRNLAPVAMPLMSANSSLRKLKGVEERWVASSLGDTRKLEDPCEERSFARRQWPYNRFHYCAYERCRCR